MMFMMKQTPKLYRIISFLSVGIFVSKYHLAIFNEVHRFCEKMGLKKHAPFQHDRGPKNFFKKLFP
jgi:hypothetical protein